MNKYGDKFYIILKDRPSFIRDILDVFHPILLQQDLNMNNLPDKFKNKKLTIHNHSYSLKILYNSTFNRRKVLKAMLLISH